MALYTKIMLETTRRLRKRGLDVVDIAWHYAHLAGYRITTTARGGQKRLDTYHYNAHPEVRSAWLSLWGITVRFMSRCMCGYSWRDTAVQYGYLKKRNVQHMLAAMG